MEFFSNASPATYTYINIIYTIPLAIIFNFSISTGVFPQYFKNLSS